MSQVISVESIVQNIKCGVATIRFGEQWPTIDCVTIMFDATRLVFFIKGIPNFFFETLESVISYLKQNVGEVVSFHSFSGIKQVDMDKEYLESL